jgi:hypothetical protein
MQVLGSGVEKKSQVFKCEKKRTKPKICNVLTLKREGTAKM